MNKIVGEKLDLTILVGESPVPFMCVCMYFTMLCMKMFVSFCMFCVFAYRPLICIQALVCFMFLFKLQSAFSLRKHSLLLLPFSWQNSIPNTDNAIYMVEVTQRSRSEWVSCACPGKTPWMTLLSFKSLGKKYVAHSNSKMRTCVALNL